jgi:hypothetical protein
MLLIISCCKMQHQAGSSSVFVQVELLVQILVLGLYESMLPHVIGQS